jgi:murein L,D-transpeptidase YcbB/YkuD
MSAVPLVVTGDASPIVGRVRERLNIPGGNVLDLELAQVLRGMQRARGLEPHGMIDELTLTALDLSAY